VPVHLILGNWELPNSVNLVEMAKFHSFGVVHEALHPKSKLVLVCGVKLDLREDICGNISRNWRSMSLNLLNNISSGTYL